MMFIKKNNSISKNTNIVVLDINKETIKAAGLSSKEEEFLHKRVKEEKKTIYINRYDYVIIFCNIHSKKQPFQINDEYRRTGSDVLSLLTGIKAKEVTVVDLSGNKGNEALALTEGLCLANYQFLKYKKDPKKEASSLQTVFIHSKSVSNQQVQQLEILVDASYKARTLVNEPASYLTAVRLSKEIESLAKASGCKVEIFNKTKIESLKMGGLLAVNKGSVDPPTFTIMEWKPAKPQNKKPYVLVGKGVVYDTGGLTLKPTPNSMDQMKCDMAGAATVSCALYAIAKAKLPIHIIALIPATDNRPGGNAYAPGDVITMFDGSTVEMLNADAEGRMILADALSYAKKYNPELVFDFATLTGAASAAIGPYGTVTMGTANENIKNKLKESGNNVYERLAEFPFWDEYGDLIKSDIADMKNVGGPYAGAITAGKFLARFVDSPWMHFDIAGPAFITGKDGYRTKGGTGVGVRLLFDFFNNI